VINVVLEWLPIEGLRCAPDVPEAAIVRDSEAVFASARLAAHEELGTFCRLHPGAFEVVLVMAAVIFLSVYSFTPSLPPGKLFLKYSVAWM